MEPKDDKPDEIPIIDWAKWVATGTGEFVGVGGISRRLRKRLKVTYSQSDTTFPQPSDKS